MEEFFKLVISGCWNYKWFIFSYMYIVFISKNKKYGYVLKESEQIVLKM